MLTTPPKQGAYPGTPFHVYRTWDALNASAINKGADLSMEHLRASMTEEGEDSPEKLLGRIAHAVTLGEEFRTLYHIYRPEKGEKVTAAGLPPLNTTDGKARYAAALAEAGSRTLIGSETVERATVIAEKLRKHELAGPLVRAAGQAEVSIVWEEDGVTCKARIDRFVAGQIALDLKTTRCAKKGAFARSVHLYGYHRQIAWYIRGFRRVYGTDTPFTVLAVETAVPYGVGVYQIDVDSLRVGMNDCEKVLRQYRECKATGVWPGYVDPETGEPGVMTVGIPEWAKKEARVLVPQEDVNESEWNDGDEDDIRSPF